MNALEQVEEAIGKLIDREKLNARIHRDASVQHFKRAAALYQEAADAYDPDKGNDTSAGDKLSRQAERENAAGDAEWAKAVQEDAKIKGKQETLDRIRRMWGAKKPIPSPI